MTETHKYPKVLVISNNGFSLSSSNGRTLGNFFKGWPKDKLAQFFISGDNLNYDLCNNYYNITDFQALNSLKGRIYNGSVVKCDRTNLEIRSYDLKKKHGRNAFTMLCRNLIWRFGRWKKYGFNDWVNDFSPNIVLLQAGDFAYMYQLALDVAKKQNAKLVIYNSEGYYFKNYDFFRGKGFFKLIYPLFWKDLKKCLRKAYLFSSHIFYSCDELKKDYDEEFKIPSETIYTASDMLPCPTEMVNERVIISYCGNLELDRYKSLIEIGNSLQNISVDLFLDVYGKTSNKKFIDELMECRGIRFHGFVSYDEVQEIIKRSDIVVHVESFEKFYREDIKYGFSTKIADLLSSGKCFLLYAPENLACTRYLLDNHVAFVVTEKQRLECVLSDLVKNKEERAKYRERALSLAYENHCGDINIRKFQEKLIEICCLK